MAPNGTATVDGQDIVAAAAAALQAAGYPRDRLAELAGGYRAWDLQYRPDGRRRAKGAFRDKSSGELEWWTVRGRLKDAPAAALLCASVPAPAAAPEPALGDASCSIVLLRCAPTRLLPPIPDCRRPTDRPAAQVP